MTDPNLYEPGAFVSRAAVAAEVERLEARALRAERAILSLQERLDAAEALARDRIAEAERLHRGLERRVRDLEARA